MPTKAKKHLRIDMWLLYRKGLTLIPALITGGREGEGAAKTNRRKYVSIGWVQRTLIIFTIYFREPGRNIKVGIERKGEAKEKKACKPGRTEVLRQFRFFLTSKNAVKDN